MAKKKTETAKTPGAIDRFLASSDAEKEAVYQSVDREIPLAETRPLTPAERRAWERTQAGLKATHAARRGRPVVGKGAKGVQVTIEGGLLADADAFAAAHGLKRAQLVAIGLRLAMAAIPAAQASLPGN
jgi:hypothetical protein